MATRGEWQRLIDLSWDLALIEDDLRAAAELPEADDLNPIGWDLARRILFERFGHS